MKICVITAIFSKNEIPKDIPFVNKKLKDIDYILYTNCKILLKKKIGWNVIYKPLKFKCPIYSNRYYKWLTHLELKNKYDIMIYVDGYLSPNIKFNWNKIFNLYKLKKFNGIIFKKHPKRNCIYDECIAVYKSKKISYHKINILNSYLKKEKMPKNYGLFENNIIIKPLNNKKLNKILELLFYYMLRFSYRDQTLLTYILWKFKFKNYLCLKPNGKYYIKSGKSGNHKYV